MQDTSDWFRKAGLMIRKRPLGEFVQTAGLGVRLDLPVPQVGVKFREPFGELCHVAGAETGDVLFDFFELGHDRKIA